jgi:dihydrofolate reductase
MRIFIAQTIDGFISGENGSLDHLEAFGGNEYGYGEMIAKVPAVVLGRRTFEAIFPEHGWTYPDGLPGVVVTNRPLPAGLPDNVTAQSDIDAIAARFPGAFIDGGAMTIAAFLARGHVTSADIFTLPVTLGGGTRLFPDSRVTGKPWRLSSVRSYPCGTVRSSYIVG